jgi:hypothetical protein
MLSDRWLEQHLVLLSLKDRKSSGLVTLSESSNTSYQYRRFTKEDLRSEQEGAREEDG